MDFLQLISNTDILCYIVSYLWIREWRALATCSECVRRLFRHKVNKSIYEMLYRAVGFGVSVAVPTIKCEDDAVYFDLKFASYHDLGPGRYANVFTGVIVGRSGNVIYRLRELCDLYKRHLRLASKYSHVELYILFGKSYELDNTDPIDLEVNNHIISDDYEEDIEYAITAERLVRHGMSKYNLWEGGRLCDQLITQVRAKEDAPLSDIHNLYE